MGWGLLGGLEVAAAVDGADHDGAAPLGARGQGEAPLAPGGPGQLAPEGGREPGRPAVERHLDPPDAARPRPGQAGDQAGVGDRGQLPGEVDAAGRLDLGDVVPAVRALPVAAVVVVDHLDALQPLHVLHAVDAGGDDPGREPVGAGQAAVVHAVGDHGGRLHGLGQRQRVRVAADGVEHHPHRPLAGAAGPLQHPGKRHPGPLGRPHQVPADQVGDALEGHVLLGRGHGQQLVVAEGERPADQPLDPQPPGALVDVGVDDRLVDGVVEPVAGDLGGEATDRPGGRVVATGGVRRRADRGGAGRAGQGLAAGVADPAGEPAHGVPGGQQPGGPDGGPEQLPPGPAQPAGRGRDRVALQPAEGAAQDAHVGHRGRRHHRAVQQQRRRPRLGPVATEGDQAEQPPGQPRRPARDWRPWPPARRRPRRPGCWPR